MSHTFYLNANYNQIMIKITMTIVNKSQRTLENNVLIKARSWVPQADTISLMILWRENTNYKHQGSGITQVVSSQPLEQQNQTVHLMKIKMSTPDILNPVGRKGGGVSDRERGATEGIVIFKKHPRQFWNIKFWIWLSDWYSHCLNC